MVLKSYPDRWIPSLKLFERFRGVYRKTVGNSVAFAVVYFYATKHHFSASNVISANYSQPLYCPSFKSRYNLCSTHMRGSCFSHLMIDNSAQFMPGFI